MTYSALLLILVNFGSIETCFNLGRSECNSNCSFIEYTCSDFSCVPFRKLKDGEKDCPNSEDENFACLEKTVICDSISRLCIDMSLQCDGKFDCPFGSDEEYCDECIGFNCINKTCVYSVPDSSFYLPINATGDCETFDDCVPQCDCPNGERTCEEEEFEHLEDENWYKQTCTESWNCKPTCKSSNLTCRFSLRCLTYSELCDGIPDCTKSFYHPLDFTDELNCCSNDEVYCIVNSNHSCIPKTKVCDGNIDCDNYIDETAELGCVNSRGCNHEYSRNFEAQAYNEDEDDGNYYSIFVMNWESPLFVCDYPNWREKYEAEHHTFQSMSHTSYTAVKITNIVVCAVGFFFGLPLNMLLTLFLTIEVTKHNNYKFLFILVGTIINIIVLIVRLLIISIEVINPKILYDELTYTSHTEKYNFPEYFYICRIINVVRVFHQFTSPMILLAVAFEQFLIRKLPLKSTALLTTRNRVIALIILTCVTTVLCICYGIGASWDFMDFPSRWVIFDFSTHCVFGILPIYHYQSNAIGNPISIIGDNKFFTYVIEALLTFVIPTTLQVFLYYNIFLKKSKNMVSKMDKKFSIFCFSASVIFVVFSIPHVFATFIKIYHSFLIAFMYGNDDGKCSTCINISNNVAHFWNFNEDLSSFPCYKLNNFDKYIIRVSESISFVVCIFNAVVYLTLLLSIKRKILSKNIKK